MTDLTRNILVGVCMIVLIALFAFSGWLIAVVNIAQGPLEAFKTFMLFVCVAFGFHYITHKMVQGKRPYTTQVICTGEHAIDHFTGQVKSWLPLKIGNQYQARDKMWEVVTLNRSDDGLILSADLEHVINLDEIYESNTKE